MLLRGKKLSIFNLGTEWNYHNTIEYLKISSPIDPFLNKYNGDYYYAKSK